MTPITLAYSVLLTGPIADVIVQRNGWAVYLTGQGLRLNNGIWVK